MTIWIWLFFRKFLNMTICNMTIFWENRKYDYLQYDDNFGENRKYDYIFNMSNIFNADDIWLLKKEKPKGAVLPYIN